MNDESEQVMDPDDDFEEKPYVDSIGMLELLVGPEKAIG
jgi:acyl carrier protein